MNIGERSIILFIFAYQILMNLKMKATPNGRGLPQLKTKRVGTPAKEKENMAGTPAREKENMAGTPAREKEKGRDSGKRKRKYAWDSSKRKKRIYDRDSRN